MKTSNKSSIITGITLLALAAVFTICLLLQLFDFGATGPGHNNIFFLLGDILTTVYGFSSILIPAFLLVSGLSCFATKWTARKTLRLLTAIIPFFTCVITENICRSIHDVSSSFSIVKIIVALITGAMLVAIEYLGIGILADKINSGAYKRSPKVKVPKAPTAKEEAVPEFKTPAPALNITPVEPLNYDGSALPAEPVKEPVYESVVEDDVSEPEDDPYNDDSIVITEDENEVFNPKPIKNKTKLKDLLKLPKFGRRAKDDEDDSFVFEDITEEVKTPTPETVTPVVEEEESLDQNPSSMITQEEFAALTAPDPEPIAQDDDELEWNNLPPKPETLPPEYDADFDENDPALEFPPKDEPVEYEEPAEPEIQETVSPAFDVDFETEFEDKDPLDDEIFQDANFVPKKVYSDEIKENPAYSHGISFGDSFEEEEEQAPAPVAAKPKYPTKITFESNPEPEDVSDDYTEDETLPFPDFDYEEPAINSVTPSEVQDDGSLVESEPEPAFEEEVFEDDFEPEEEPEANVFAQISQSENHSVFSGANSSVFSEMEEDIRRHQKQAPAPAVQDEEPEVEVSFDGIHQVQHENAPSLDRPAASANNLTADELTDFFNAQQAENMPQTNTIQAAPPKVGNRAVKKGPYIIPSDLLTAYKDDQYWIIDDATKQASLNLKQTLAEFNIEADITGIKKGPVVTMFEILPAPGVKLSKIVALQDNIALSLAAQSVRIVAPIPGKQAVGIEVPNKHRSVVGFREIIEMDLAEWNKMAVPVVLGKDILGKAQLIDLAKTPHMLIAGATGSGKSVCVNSLILSILYKRSPQDVKMIMVDPKVVELKLYNNIPHLLTPVITEPKKALQALQWCLCEMERRYALLDGMGVRDISNYNTKIKEQKICTERLPYIVVIIDEFADLMATSGKELETIVARLTAMSRAVGIHLVLATQRPSVNVITGLIKANIPTRIAFMVASRTDSNIIIDTVGAEKLLGRGDMLYASATDPAPIRIQGTFVNDNEVEEVVNAVKEYGEPDYIDEEIFVEDDEEGARDLFGDPMDDDDPLYDQALKIVVEEGKASASYLQRRLKIGYNRAARLVEEMEDRGIVGPANGSKPRDVIHVPM